MTRADRAERKLVELPLSQRPVSKLDLFEWNHANIAIASMAPPVPGGGISQMLEGGFFTDTSQNKVGYWVAGG